MPSCPHELSLTEFAGLPGWAEDRHGEALAAFRHSARRILEGHGFERGSRLTGQIAHWQAAAAQALGADAARDPRGFFENHFTPFSLRDPDRPQGLFTGYYEAEAHGSRTPHPDFPVPVYARPPELVKLSAQDESRAGFRYGLRQGDRFAPFASRAEIEAGALAGRGLERVWLSSWVDAFFIHIQGSGRVRLTDGSLMRLAFAAKNGRAYTGIGAGLIADGIISEAEMSMQAVRAWMAANPDAARARMQRNDSYIFFREVAIADDTAGPPAAAAVNLTPERSLAVDRSVFAFGVPLFLDTACLPHEGAGETVFRRLMIAQDTGTAIRGIARGDIFFGAGAHAAWAAGHQKHEGRLTLLLPKGLTW